MYCIKLCNTIAQELMTLPLAIILTVGKVSRTETRLTICRIGILSSVCGT